LNIRLITTVGEESVCYYSCIKLTVPVISKMLTMRWGKLKPQRGIYIRTVRT